ERIADEPHLRLHHSCSPHHQNSALYPIIARLEHAAGFSRDDTLLSKRSKLERVLGPAAEASSDALPMMQALLGLLPEDQLAALAPTAEQEKARTFKALLAQLEDLARQQPVLMVFEDVQWIDPTTSELLGAVIDRIQTLKVLLIVTYRPEFAPPWTGHAHV